MRYGDFLMGDKSIESKVGKMVIAATNGNMTVKRLSEVDRQMTLIAGKLHYPDMNDGNLGESMF